jgi:hypothetical protein
MNEFYKLAELFGSSSVSFQEVSDNGPMAPTRYGREVFGRFARVSVMTPGRCCITSPVILLTDDVYNRLHEAGCKTND